MAVDLWFIELFENLTFFLFFAILIAGIIGFWSQSFAVGGFGGYLFLITFAIETDVSLFVNMTYVILVTVSVLLGLRIWSFGTGGGEPA